MRKRSLLLTSVAGIMMLLASCGQQPQSSSQTGFSSSGGGGGTTSQSGDGSGTGPIISSTDTESSEEEQIPGQYKGKLRIWYHRDDMNYDNMRIYLWNQAVDGVEYEFTGEDEEYGVYFDVDLGTSEQFKDAPSTDIRVIFKKAGTWAGQSLDTFCVFEDFEVTDDVMNMYLAAGEGSSIDQFARRVDALGDHFDVAYMNSDWRTITVTGTGTKGSRRQEEVGLISSYKLYGFTKEFYALTEGQQEKRREEFLIESKTLNTPTAKLDLVLKEKIDPTTQYIVYGTFKMDETREKSKAVSARTLYDTQEFKDNYYYDGDDLGVTITKDGNDTLTTFKVWAPTASNAKVRAFLFGTPSSLGGADNAVNYKMEYLGKGVWGTTLKNTYYKWYNFVVTNSNGTVEAVDPYAKATGLNGLRGAILDWNDASVVDPEGWNDGQAVDSKLPAIKSANNLSVYEIHIRDLTSDATWTSNQGNLRGGYNAFAEEGTTYKNVKTGFDHIKELGVNAIQLLPVFDQDNDERQTSIYESTENGGKLNETTYNWGYNPQNYNVVEGAYSSDPTSATTRILEYKNLIKKAADNGIRVIMDVVYNHMASVANNSFTKIVPQYFFRTNPDGNYYDGTGCGNVVASERPMASKFIAESVAWWAKEYRVKGFRFDLMGCIDLDTMKAVRTAVNKVDPSIVVYGEGWTGDMGGHGGLPSEKASESGNVYSQLNVDANFPIGGFNDAGRDGAKGNDGSDKAPEIGDDNGRKNWLTKDSTQDNVYNTLTMAIGENRWAKNGDHPSNPNQTVNYLACHDNYTLYDQINYQFEYYGTKKFQDGNNEWAMKAATSLTSFILFGQGIAFIHGGDEIFRQKVMHADNPLLADMQESYHQGSYYHEDTGKTDYWQEGDGVPVNSAKTEWLVRNSYKYGDAVNSFKWDRKADATVNKYYNKVKEAVALRKAQMGNALGQSLAQILGQDGKGGKVTPEGGQPYCDDGTWCWDYNDLFDGEGKSKTSIIAAGFIGQKDGKGIYMLLNKGVENASIGIGNGNVKVLYSSTGRTSATISDNSIKLDQFECLIIQRESGNIR